MAGITAGGLLLALFSPVMGFSLGFIGLFVGQGLFLISMGLRNRQFAQLTEHRYASSIFWRSAHRELVMGSILSSCGLLVFVAILIGFFIVKGTLLDLWLLVFVATSVLFALPCLIITRSYLKRTRRILETMPGEAVQRSASRAFPQPKEAREE